MFKLKIHKMLIRKIHFAGKNNFDRKIIDTRKSNLT